MPWIYKTATTDGVPTDEPTAGFRALHDVAPPHWTTPNPRGVLGVLPLGWYVTPYGAHIGNFKGMNAAITAQQLRMP